MSQDRCLAQIKRIFGDSKPGWILLCDHLGLDAEAHSLRGDGRKDPNESNNSRAAVQQAFEEAGCPPGKFFPTCAKWLEQQPNGERVVAHCATHIELNGVNMPKMKSLPTPVRPELHAYVSQLARDRNTTISEITNWLVERQFGDKVPVKALNEAEQNPEVSNG